MAQEYNVMSPTGETVAAPLREFGLTNDGEAAAYEPTELEEHTDDDGEHGGAPQEEPTGAGNEDGG